MTTTKSNIKLLTTDETLLGLAMYLLHNCRIECATTGGGQKTITIEGDSEFDGSEGILAKNFRLNRVMNITYKNNVLSLNAIPLFEFTGAVDPVPAIMSAWTDTQSSGRQEALMNERFSDSSVGPQLMSDAIAAIDRAYHTGNFTSATYAEFMSGKASPDKDYLRDKIRSLAHQLYHAPEHKRQELFNAMNDTQLAHKVFAVELEDDGGMIWQYRDSDGYVEVDNRWLEEIGLLC